MFDFYRKFEPLKETTFRWRLFNLKENKIIRSLTKDIFTFNSLPDYYPEVTNENKELISLLLKQFSDLKLSTKVSELLKS